MQGDDETAVSIVLVDDHPLYRDGVVRTLNESRRFRVVAEGGTADEAVELVRAHRPALALVDISMPGSGITAARRICAGFPGTAVVMLTASEADDDVMEALKAGARGYVLKGVGGAELMRILDEVASGGSYVQPALAARLLTAMRSREREEAGAAELVGELTKREEDILKLVAQGKSNKEVARDLDLQEKTVKHYMTNILQKLQVRNRTEAALIAREVWGKRD
ncbi:MAG: DNA-binding response regulator [Alphaproteobacteria bacterium]|nr:MAG: DNA-binding response regulator [Alphaproteobacteria bacterium]